MKKSSYWILLLMLAFAFACPACGNGDELRARVAETSVANFQPSGGFITASGSFIGGGEKIVVTSPSCGRQVVLPELPSGAEIRGLYQAGDCVVAVGSLGLVLFSGDGGVSFELSTDDTVLTSGVTLNAVAVADSTVVAVGNSGVIVTNALSDLGTPNTWTAQTSGVTTQLNGVTKAGTLWVVVGDDGTALTSPDLITWTPVTDDDVLSKNHNAVIATSAGDLVVAGDSGSIVVLPSGTTDYLSVDSGVSVNLNALVEVPGSAVVVVGDDGTIISAADPTVAAGQPGGWTKDEDQVADTSKNFRAVAVTADGLTRVIVTGNDTVLEADEMTGDPGPDRIYVNCELGGLRAVHATSKKDVYYVGLNGLILQRSDGTLRLVPSPTAQDLNDVFAASTGSDTTQAWAVGEAGNFIRINRDGSTLTATVECDGCPGIALNGIFGSSADNVFAVGNMGTIWRLTDSVTPNWAPQSSPLTADKNLNDVWVTGTDATDFLAVAVASSGEVISRDQGSEFAVVPLSAPISTSLNAVYGCSDDTGLKIFTPGDGGTVFRHTPVLDAGVLTSLTVEDVSPTFTGIVPNLLGTWCSSPTRVFVVGEPTESEATALEYDGTAWSSVSDVVNNVPTTAVLYDVYGTDTLPIDFVGATTADPDANIVLIRLEED